MHNKQQQSNSVKVAPFVRSAQKPPLLLRGCAGRYKSEFTHEIEDYEQEKNNHWLFNFIRYIHAGNRRCRNIHLFQL